MYLMVDSNLPPNGLLRKKNICSYKFNFFCFIWLLTDVYHPNFYSIWSYSVKLCSMILFWVMCWLLTAKQDMVFCYLSKVSILFYLFCFVCILFTSCVASFFSILSFWLICNLIYYIVNIIWLIFLLFIIYFHNLLRFKCSYLDINVI